MSQILLLDMDGPLADFDKKYFDLCEANNIVMDATYETQSHRYASKHILDDGQRDWATSVVHAPGWFIDLPVTEGALDGLNKIVDVFDVWIVTKPLEANQTCRDEKAAWIRHHLGAEWEGKLIVASDKSKVVGDILLDDAPMMEWLPGALWSPVIFPTTWNGKGSQWAGLPKWSWKNTAKALLKLANERE